MIAIPSAETSNGRLGEGEGDSEMVDHSLERASAALDGNLAAVEIGSDRSMQGIPGS